MELDKAWDTGVKVAGALLVILTLYLFSPFIGDIVFALLLAYVALPLRRSIKGHVGHRDLMAFITTTLIILGIVLPALLGLRFMQGKIVVGVRYLVNQDILSSEHPLVMLLFQEWEQFQEMTTLLNAVFDEPYIGPVLDQFALLVATLPERVIHLFMFLVFLFYFIRDGPELHDKVLDFLPKKQRKRVEEYLHVADIAIYATIFGRFITGIVCAFTSASGLFILGIPNATLLGVAAGIIFIIPQIGVWILYIPLSAYWASLGLPGRGALILVLGIAIGLLDNVVYSLIVGDRMSRHGVHPVFTLVGLLGGLLVWGFKGLVLGPIVVALSISFIRTMIVPVPVVRK